MVKEKKDTKELLNELEQEMVRVEKEKVICAMTRSALLIWSTSARTLKRPKSSVKILSLNMDR